MLTLSLTLEEGFHGVTVSTLDSESSNPSYTAIRVQISVEPTSAFYLTTQTCHLTVAAWFQPTCQDTGARLIQLSLKAYVKPRPRNSLTIVLVWEE